MMLAALAAFAGPAAAQPAQADPVVTARAGYELRLIGGGLTSGQRGLHSYPVFLFGITRTEAIQRVAALRGRASVAGNSSCGGQMLNFTRFGTLTLWFRGNRWVGWSLAGPANAARAASIIHVLVIKLSPQAAQRPCSGS